MQSFNKLLKPKYFMKFYFDKYIISEFYDATTLLLKQQFSGNNKD